MIYRKSGLITALRVTAINFQEVADFIRDPAYPRFTQVTNPDGTLAYYEIPRSHGLLRVWEGDYLVYGLDNVLRAQRAWDFHGQYYPFKPS